jgi:hypothetical protein
MTRPTSPTSTPASTTPSSPSGPSSTRRWGLALLPATAALALAGCGDGSEAAGAPVTVTVTPTVTASPKASPTRTEPTKPAAPKSDVVGRGYDFGTVTDLKKVGDTEVLELDRWTWKGLDDGKLARDGVPLSPFKGQPYTNQNDRLTYTIPVAEDARVLYHHCVKAGEPQQTRSATIKEMSRLEKRENLVLVRLDDRGRAVAVDNLPGCPD